MNKENYLAIVSALFLLGLFLVSFGNNYYSNYSSFCEGNNSCILDLIKETSNYSLCNISNDKDSCFFKLADYKLNPSFCKVIGASEEKSNCFMNLALKTSNNSLCNSTNEYDKCIFQIALNEENYKLCYLTNNSNKCIYSYAYYTHNISLCNLTGNLLVSCEKKLDK